MTPDSPALAAARRAALSLSERLAAIAGPSDAGDPAESAGGEVVDRWRKMLDRGGPDRFARRLRWDGLAERDVRAALHAPPALGGESEWAGILAEACRAAGDAWDPADPALSAGQPVAFEEVLLPFVQVGRRLARERYPEMDAALEPAAGAALDHALLDELSDLAATALLLDFSVERARRGSAGVSLGERPRAAYLAFVHGLRGARLEPLVTRYPVLARLLAVRTGLWVAAATELAARSSLDAEALGALFGTGHPGRVAAVRTGRGETHCAGRTVAAVRFSGGLEVMYKPRSLKLDMAFYGLLEWLGENGLQPAQRVLRVLDRGAYGWVEFVHAAPVAAEHELRDYYERGGALLCVAYLLGATDLHAENLLAAGAHPVPVDLETIVGAPVQSGRAAADPTRRPTATSGLLATGLLPYWQVAGEGHQFCPGGLGLLGEPVHLVARGWRDVNTDRMAREDRPRVLELTASLPHLRGVPAPPAWRVDDIVRGFERCHQFLEANRAALVSPGGPLAPIRGNRLRVILRDTRVYGAALRASLHPAALHDGVERSLQLEVLRTSALLSDQPLPYWAAFASEQRDLEALDYPYFWAFTDGTVLHDSRGEAVGPFCETHAYDQAVARLQRFDDDDRRLQSALVRFIYGIATSPAATVAGAIPAGAPLDPETALEEARAIGRALEAMAQRDPDGAPRWVGMDRGNRAEGDSLRPLGERLYDGRAGVALFLAALDATAATGHAGLAAEALLPLRRALRDPRGRAGLATGLGIGAGLGMGGIAYTLGQVGRLTGDARYWDDARLAARTLTARAISADPVLELLGGAAGAAMALLSLHEMTGDAWLLQRAAACGRHLLARRGVDPATGLAAWPTGGGRFATGFAHGAGGIAAALLRLAHATGDESFMAAAEAGYAYEAAVSGAPHATAGRHAAADAASPWSRTWCNGAVGVALGRVIHGLDASAAVLAEAAAADPGPAPDHPCCGTLGRAELLLAAGDLAGARALAGPLVARARARRSYHISREVPDARYAPAFFQGLSGIGYQLLRLADPERLPSVLAFR